MLKKRSTKLMCLLIAFLWTTVIIGSSYAYFIDSVTVTGNVVTSGNLKAEMLWSDDRETWYNAEDPDNGTIFSGDRWEPNYTEVKYIQVKNTGNLAFQYRLNVVPAGILQGHANLMDVIDVYYGEVTPGMEKITKDNYKSLNKLGPLSDLMYDQDAMSGILLPNSTTAKVSLPNSAKDIAKTGSVEFYIVLHMQEEAGNEYQGLSAGNGFNLQLSATQYTYEEDSFGNTYDEKSEYPELIAPTVLSVNVQPDANGCVPHDVAFNNPEVGVSAIVPAGAKMAPGATNLTLVVEEKKNSEADVTLSKKDKLTAFNVKVEGLAADNTVPVIINMGKAMSEGMNLGNYDLYHVENGVTTPMTLVGSAAELDAHNEFFYNPATGEVIVAMATFSEVAVVEDTENAWKGKFDYSWYTGVQALSSDADYVIANADQLAAFGAIVGGMDGQEKNSFSGKTVKLLSDINLGDAEKSNVANKIFYPIGYYNSTGSYDKKSGMVADEAVTSNVSAFSGTFDGNGHTIKNFYQNTWEMFGDYNDGYSGTPNHYKDAMGLFGYVNGGTVKNLTVDNFSSDGEFTPTGVIAAYAVNSTFENIAITNCNPRVYNTGNGGIVGIGGNSDDKSDKKLTFTNITIDNTNKITALWGSWDVACGGLVGMFRGNSTVKFTNCHVAAQIDAYNDVCGNYQYYWYRYSGMMIGSIRGKNKVVDGYTVPDTTGITAENCTVHFGKWNDYYYCELVANTLASYTHDHQFSRLEQINSLDEIKSGDTWTKAGNFLLIAADGTKTCYHIVNKNGTLTQHLHTDAGEETVNGGTVLKEDKQIVYLPFNQLFQGDGWGVKHIPVYNGDDYAFDGITILDREVADSVVKFEKASAAKDSYTTGTTVAIGDLFAAIEDAGVAIKDDKVQVFASPAVGTNSTAGGTYTANTTDWTQGTLTFTGTGKATITITDYYYCKTTTLDVTITEKVAVEKFETKFTGDFLYRVGNANTVALSSLFKVADGVTNDDIGTVEVTVETVNGTATSGTYTSNANWTNGTIQFSGTGVVKVTITDNDYCTPTELYLEVVDAVNATGATSATKNNVVLLNDVTNGSFSVGGGYAFYGNGFTITLNPASHTTKRGAGFDGYIHMTGGTLDNVVIEGPVFAAANIYRSQGETGTGSDDPVNYFRNAVIIDGGDCKITNSYISGGRAAVYVKDGGDVVFDNTTVSGGAYANIEVSVADSVTFRDLTTVQTEQQDDYDQGKTMIGIGIVVDNAETEVYLDGALKQYNWITQTQWENMLGDYVGQFPAFFTDSTYQPYWHYRNGDSSKYVNLSLIFACDWDSSKLHDNRTDKTITYTSMNVTVAGSSGGVYSVTGAGTLTDTLYKAPEYKPNAHYAVPPTPTFDFTNKNYQAYVDGESEYCYYDAGVVKIGFTVGGSKEWDTSILTVKKGSNTVSIGTVTMDGMDYTGGSITFTESGDYVVTYTYTDPYNYKLDADGNIATYSKAYTQTVNITVNAAEVSAKNATITMGKDKKLVEKIQIGDKTYLSATGVNASLTNSGTIKFPQSDGDTSTISFKYSGKTNGSWGSATINDQTFYFPIVAMGTTDSKWSHTGSWYGCFPVFEGAFTITDYADGGTGTEVIYNSSTTTMPADLAALYPQTVFRYQGTQSKVPTAPSTMTKGTYNGKLCYTTQTDLSASNERGEEWNLATYTYEDNKGATYYWYVAYYCAASTNGGCVTPDTLVTLADGSKKEIQYVTYEDQLLVWDFYKGEYAAVPSAIIFNHGEDNFNIIHLTFDDGTVVKVIAEHRFLDAETNDFVRIDEFNAQDYVDHSFYKRDGDGYTTVKLVKAEVKLEHSVAYSLISALHYNFFVEDLFSSPFLEKDVGAFEYFDIAEDELKYINVEEDIAKYGLYSYEEFAPYITEEQYDAFNAQYMKIAVGKGDFTFDEILRMINEYLTEAQ